MSAMYFKSQPVFIRNIWDQILFYFIYVDDLKPFISSLDAVHGKFFQMLGIIQSFHSIYLSGKIFLSPPGGLFHGSYMVLVTTLERNNPDMV